MEIFPTKLLGRYWKLEYTAWCDIRVLIVSSTLDFLSAASNIQEAPRLSGGTSLH
jgi:hypothetical protein